MAKRRSFSRFLKSLRSEVLRNKVGGAAGFLLTLLVGIISLFSPAGGKLRRTSYDLPLALHSTPAPTEVVLVYLDDQSHKLLNQPASKAWDRHLHAQLLEQLTIEKAKVVVFDIVFRDSATNHCADAAADEHFIRAMQGHSNVVLAGEHPVAGVAGGTTRILIAPYERYKSAARAWGTATFEEVDPDFGIRRLMGEVEVLGAAVPTLPGAAVQVLQGTNNLFKAGRERWLHYYDEPNKLEHCSYYQVISNYARPGLFKDKVVFVGARQSSGFTGSGKDQFVTAYTPLTGEHASGVEIHATAFLNLLRGEWLTRLPSWAECLLVILCGILFGYGLVLLSPLAALGVASIGILVAIVPAHLSVWYSHVWFAWAVLVVQIGVASGWAITFSSLRSYLEKRLLEQSLSYHLPPARVKQILRRPELLQPSAEKQEVSLLFTDIADFSTISDRMLPDRLFQLLCKYFAETIPCVHAQDGMVVQLVGDAIFALWNAPEPQKNYCELACRAALRLRDKLVQFESANESFPLKTRVGLHAGLASVGNCGSAERFTYTALGAETNMASRLEGLNKYLGTEILASSNILAPVEQLFVFRPVGHFRLQGGDRVMEINELIGTAESGEQSKSWRDAFADALRRFKRGDFAEAEAGFKTVLGLRPKDGPTHFYLDLLQHFQTDPPPKGWLGEVNMASK